MSPELTPILIAVATVGVALAALMVGLFAWLRQDARQTEDRLTDRFNHLEARTDQRLEQMEARTDQRLEQMEARINERIGQLESRTTERFDQADGRIDALERDHQERFASLDRGQAELRERMAKLEGLLEGLREAVTGHRAAS
jgi:TolA-binding protein